MIRCAFALLLATLLVTQSEPLAQEHPPGHEQFGSVTFDTSCAPSVSESVNRAVALLHSFEFRPAIDAFTAVLAGDPSCAMAYWGIALSYWGNPFAGIKAGPLLESGRAAVQKGLSTGTPSARERAYLAAVNELFANIDPATHRQRTLAYASAMEKVQRDFPSDTEARIFYALAVNQTADPTDKQYSAQLQAAGILEPLWKRYPNHPGLAHYIIHAYDSPALAARALGAARQYATIAPSAPHALHMPSHTFTRLGYWKESADTNTASEQTALREGSISEALHAMDYQIYAYLQMADDDRAREVMRRTPPVASQLDVNAVGGAAPAVAGAYAAAAIPARFVLERGAWNEAAALPLTSSMFPYADAVTHFARAIGAARSGQPAAAARDIDELAVLRDKLAQMHDGYWREQVDIQRRAAQAWVAFAQGREGEGIDLMREAADAEDATDKAAISPGPLAPARELLGEMLLAAGDVQGALTAFELTMAKEPNRFRGVFGGASAAEQAGSEPLARQYYEKLLEVAGGGSANRPELQHARTFGEGAR